MKLTCVQRARAGKQRLRRNTLEGLVLMQCYAVSCVQRLDRNKYAIMVMSTRIQDPNLQPSISTSGRLSHPALSLPHTDSALARDAHGLSGISFPFTAATFQCDVHSLQDPGLLVPTIVAGTDTNSDILATGLCLAECLHSPGIEALDCWNTFLSSRCSLLK